MLPDPAEADVERVARALGWRPTTFRPAGTGRADTPAGARWIVSDGRRSAFVKIGSTELTARWFRHESDVYRGISGWFLPRVLGFDDDGERPVIALEDLSAADWPPPWTDRRIALVLEAFAAIRSTPPPPIAKRFDEDLGAHWRAVADEPGPLLGVGLCSRTWLEGALPVLIHAAEAAPLHGDALCHFDVRSDNLCFRAGRAVIIDWSHATRANPDLDIAAWLPSLTAEGGPLPETILPEAPGLAAWMAGFFCRFAGLPEIPEAPHVRTLQRIQAATALPWAARALGLPPPS